MYSRMEKMLDETAGKLRTYNHFKIESYLNLAAHLRVPLITFRVSALRIDITTLIL